MSSLSRTYCSFPWDGHWTLTCSQSTEKGRLHCWYLTGTTHVIKVNLASWLHGVHDHCTVRSLFQVFWKITTFQSSENIKQIHTHLTQIFETTMVVLKKKRFRSCQTSEGTGGLGDWVQCVVMDCILEQKEGISEKQELDSNLGDTVIPWSSWSLTLWSCKKLTLEEFGWRQRKRLCVFLTFL